MDMDQFLARLDPSLRPSAVAFKEALDQFQLAAMRAGADCAVKMVTATAEERAANKDRWTQEAGAACMDAYAHVAAAYGDALAAVRRQAAANPPTDEDRLAAKMELLRNAFRNTPTAYG